jgi:hypothetical protein
MTATLKPPPPDAPDAGVIEEARGRQRRHRGAAGGAIVALIIAALLLAFAGGGSGSPPVIASGPAGRPLAKGARQSSSTCPSGRGRALQGAPSRSLLAILGVLRRPASSADAIGAHLVGRGIISDVFVHYIRRARVVSGSSYYVYPAIIGGCGTGESKHQGIADLAMHVNLGAGIIGGTGGGGASAAEIESGRDVGSGPPGSSTSATLTMIVPDGVANVEFRYPAGRASGYSPKVSPPFAATAAAINNEVVVRIPRSSPLQNGTMIWRAADGRVIRRFSSI